MLIAILFLFANQAALTKLKIHKPSNEDSKKVQKKCCCYSGNTPVTITGVTATNACKDALANSNCTTDPRTC
jgi:hypothetical protein